MAIFKCKMCGGDIPVTEGATVGTCNFCNSISTLPKASDKKLVNLFNRANHYRQQNEFDKAIATYESILNEDDTNAEAHWGVVLCRYGIEYVEDPRTHERVPTCHRVQFAPILSDADYLAALENAPDSYARDLYETEAKKISKIQKSILAISNKEEPFDVFICYKESTDGGSRTKDSALAHDIYSQLTKEGYRVFFSRITLEKIPGQKYEPYIFAALNSAKVMLVVGTKPEYFNAAWVKNEWSRYLALMKNDSSRLMIPCYRDMDPYDIPEEISGFGWQAQDMGKIGFVQDLIHGIKKVLGTETVTESTGKTAKTAASGAAAPGVESLMKRGWLFLEDSDWKQASEYFDKVLDIDPEYAPGYIGKLCAKLTVNKEADLAQQLQPFGADVDYKKALRFANAGYKAKLEGYIRPVQERFVDLRKSLVRYHRCIAAAGIYHTVGLKADGTVVAVGGNEYGQCNVSDWQNIVAIAATDYHTVGLKADGMVVAVGENNSGQCNVSDWRDIVAIAAAGYHTVGLKADGTVVAIGDNEYGQCNVSDWQNIVAIAAGHWHTVGLKADGTVVAVGDNDKGQCNVADWQDIIAIAADYHTVGLKADGTVVAVGNNNSGLCNVSDWQDIVAIAADYHTVGLKADGTVVAVGDNDKGQCNVADWQNIVAIAAAGYHTVGLKADGTVVAIGDNEYGQCNVSDWRDIVAIVGARRTVGLKADGTVVAVGWNEYGQCNVSDWQNIGPIPDEKRPQMKQAAQERERLDQERLAKKVQEMSKTRESFVRYDRCIAAGIYHTVGLKADGTVVAVGAYIPEFKRKYALPINYGQCNVSDWWNIIAVAAPFDGSHTVGLKADGTVVAVGDNDKGQCNVSDWRDIVAIATSWRHTVGLKADGTVVAVGDNEDGQCNISDWQNIVAIATAGCLRTVGLKADGTVVGDSRTSGWRDIVAITSGGSITVGVKADGTVVTVRYNNNKGQCNVSDWRDIVAIAIGHWHTVGLKADGTVVAVGWNEHGQCNISGWRDIVAIAAGYHHTVGLKADGTVVAVGLSEDGQCNVSDWCDIGPVSEEKLLQSKQALQEQGRQEEEEDAHKIIKIKQRKKIKMAAVVASIIIATGFGLYEGWFATVFNRHLAIPYDAVIIAENEFAGRQLTTAEIPYGITYIGERAFARNGLRSVEIPASVVSIGSGAFRRNRLTSITIGANVTLGNSTFGSGFKDFYLNNGMAAGTYTRPNIISREWSAWHGDFRFRYEEGNITITGFKGIGGDIKIPAEISGRPVTIIKDSAFRDSRLTSLKIPDTVVTIGNEAFRNNQLVNVDIGNSVISIGDNAFDENQLTSVIIPNSVVTIGNNAFCCNQLTTVTIGNNVRYIGNAAFTAGALGESRLASVIIPNRVTIIGNSAFRNQQLTSVTIGNSVTSIGFAAFHNNQLTSIFIPNSVRDIAVHAFTDNPITSVRIGPNVNLGSGDNDAGVLGFRTGFNTAYANARRQAGTFTRPNTNSTSWTRR